MIQVKNNRSASDKFASPPEMIEASSEVTVLAPPTREGFVVTIDGLQIFPPDP
jgi:hypothetical protein